MVSEINWALGCRALLVWVGMLVVAIFCGGIRERFFVPWLGQIAALRAGGIMLCLAILALAYRAAPWLGVWQLAPLGRVGLLWLGLTVAFETLFALGRGQTMAEIQAAYTMRDGNLWPVVLVVIAVSPLVAAWLRRWG